MQACTRHARPRDGGCTAGGRVLCAARSLVLFNSTSRAAGYHSARPAAPWSMLSVLVVLPCLSLQLVLFLYRECFSASRLATPSALMETTVRPAEVFTPKPAKRRKKKAGVAAAAVCDATPAARVVREGSVEKTVKKKKKKKKAAAGTGLMDRAVCAASSSSAIEPRAVAAIATKEDGLEGIFASLTEKKAARDAKRKVREEEEAAEAAAAAAAAKKAAKEARDLPRDSVFGEVYDPNTPFDPMSAPIHRVRRRVQKLEPQA